MPYMYCNHTGCKETVRLPLRYCIEHTDTNDTEQLELIDRTLKEVKAEIKAEGKTKKTTK